MRARVDDGQRWQTGSGRAAAGGDRGSELLQARGGWRRPAWPRLGWRVTVWERPLLALRGPVRVGVRFASSTHIRCLVPSGSLTGVPVLAARSGCEAGGVRYLERGRWRAHGELMRRRRLG
jgi:hypothetical protein